MSKSTAKAEPTGYPEFAVRRETISQYFSPPLARSTFHDLVNHGRIVHLKGIRGFYKLNDSLHRLCLREVPELPKDIPSECVEKLIRLTLHEINPELINVAGNHLTEPVFTGCSGHVNDLPDTRHKLAYLQGVLDVVAMMEMDHEVSPR